MHERLPNTDLEPQVKKDFLHNLKKIQEFVIEHGLSDHHISVHYYKWSINTGQKFKEKNDTTNIIPSYKSTFEKRTFRFKKKSILNIVSKSLDKEDIDITFFPKEKRIYMEANLDKYPNAEFLEKLEGNSQEGTDHKFTCFRRDSRTITINSPVSSLRQATVTFLNSSTEDIFSKLQTYISNPTGE